MTAFDEKMHRLCYEIIKTNPFKDRNLNSITAEVKLLPITEDNTTFMSWTHDFSNMSDTDSILEKREEKLSLFAEMKKRF
jgi:hypothetical protein